MSLDQVRVFYGQATDTLANVYLELDESLSRSPELRAEIHGPACSLTRTLSHSTPFHPFDSPRRFRAQIPDPCFWSPERPMRYSIRVQPGDGAEPIVWSDFGIRHLGSDRGQLWLAGRRWVLRAAHWPESLAERNMSAWQEGRLAMVVRTPTPEICQQASQAGVMLVVWLDADRVVSQLVELSRWAAVAAALWTGPPPADPASLRQAAPNLLLGYQPTDAHFAGELTWADLLVCPTDAVFLDQVARVQPPRTIFGLRPAGRLQTVPEARAACDRLQRDLAPRYDLSGYLV